VNRIEQVRQVVDETLRQQLNEEERRCGFVHLYGVAQACALLALRRGLDPELGTIAGMLHDLCSYKTLDTRDHGPRGAVLARGILEDLGSFRPNEIEAICHAIEHHSDKAGVHGPLDELLKDADELSHYLYNTLFPVIEKEKERLPMVLAEVGTRRTL